MAGVLVFGEIAGGALHEASLEALTAGASLAQKLGVPLIGALIGAGAREAADKFQCGSARLLLCGQQLAHYDGDRYAACAQRVFDATGASIVLAPHTMQTRDWMPRLATRASAALQMNCTALVAEADALVVTRPIYGGGAVAELALRGSPILATVSAGAFAPATGSSACTVEAIDDVFPPDARIELIEEVSGDTGEGLRLQDAKIVVSGGRGLGGPDNWHYIEEAAAQLGAAIGCSRPVVDSGWVNVRHQVGLSGSSVTPDVYIAVGISGAVHHLAGIVAAKTVVAINSDADAQIFRRANFGAVGDFREVLPAFVARLKELREG